MKHTFQLTAEIPAYWDKEWFLCNTTPPQVKKVTVWGSPRNGGDGSVHNKWFLTQEEAEQDQDNESENGEGWAECCSFPVETFEGSNVHKSALEG